MSGKSKRFTETRWTRWLVPAVFMILLIALVATLVVVGLSLAGLTPAF